MAIVRCNLLENILLSANGSVKVDRGIFVVIAEESFSIFFKVVRSKNIFYI